MVRANKLRKEAFETGKVTPSKEWEEENMAVAKFGSVSHLKIFLIT